MNYSKILLLIIILSLYSLHSIGQNTLNEGILTYKADTVSDSNNKYIVFTIQELKIYKKGNRTRFEMKRVGSLNDPETLIQIINEDGLYHVRKTATRTLPIFFMTHKEIDEDLAAQSADGSYREAYIVPGPSQKIRYMGIKAEKVYIKTFDSIPAREMIISKKLISPVTSFFATLRHLKGTPLQFTETGYGRLTRFSLVNIEAKSLPDSLFQVRNKNGIISLEKMEKKFNKILEEKH